MNNRMKGSKDFKKNYGPLEVVNENCYIARQEYFQKFGTAGFKLTFPPKYYQDKKLLKKYPLKNN